MGAKEKNKKFKPNFDGGNNGKHITDARFASLHSDPRFREPPKRKAKVAIDSRFNRMFTDKNFATFRARIDKRGKPKKNDTAANPLKHYYRFEEEDDEKERKLGEKLLKNDEDNESEDDEESDEEIESENDKVKKQSLKLKNESTSSSSSSSDDENEDKDEEGESDDDDSSLSTSTSSSTDSDEEDGEYEEEEQEEKIPEIDKETHRLAVVNMDWSEVKAVDLYVLLSSFLPKDGHIVSVAVYPSEFGLKRVEEEAIHGPVALFDDDKNKNDDGQSDDEIDNEKLRAYELSRLR